MSLDLLQLAPLQLDFLLPEVLPPLLHLPRSALRLEVQDLLFAHLLPLSKHRFSALPSADFQQIRALAIQLHQRELLCLFR